MKRACIAIVDGSSARIYTYLHHDGARPALNEETDLVNRSVRGAAPDAKDGEFAARIIDEVDRIISAAGIGHVILVASPMMAGHLRTRDDQLTRRGIVVDEIVRDLSRLTSAGGHDPRSALDGIGPLPPAAFARR